MIPADYEILIVNWLQFKGQNLQPWRNVFWEVTVEHPVGRFELSNICNIDETPIPFKSLQGKTYKWVGAKPV